MDYQAHTTNTGSRIEIEPDTGATPEPALPLRQLRMAEEFIRANILNPVEIADIASAAEINVRALQRLFRKEHGASPLQVLLAFRIATAREIILRGDVSSVREVAAQLHFSNPGRFSKLYQKVHSYIPSREIRQCRNDLSMDRSAD